MSIFAEIDNELSLQEQMELGADFVRLREVGKARGISTRQAGELEETGREESFTGLWRAHGRVSLFVR